MDKQDWKLKVSFLQGGSAEYRLANRYTREEAQIVYENIQVDFMRFKNDSDKDHEYFIEASILGGFACIPYKDVGSFSIELFLVNNRSSA